MDDEIGIYEVYIDIIVGTFVAIEANSEEEARRKALEEVSHHDMDATETERMVVMVEKVQ